MRRCFTSQVRSDCIDEHVERHRSTWPEPRAVLRDSDWHNYSLFPPDGRPPGESFEPLIESLDREDQLSIHRAQPQSEEK